MRCPWPGAAGASHAGETRPLLRDLRKAIPLNPHGEPGKGAGDDTFKLPPRKAAEQTSRRGSAAEGGRDGCSAHETPAERRAGLRARPALLPSTASPGCLQVAADFTPHPSLAAFQMPFFRRQNQVFARRGKRVAGGKRSQSETASNSAHAPSPRSWMQAQEAFRILISPRAFPRWRWVRSPSCKCLFISYRALQWVSNK